jgi:hypothetical protein
MIYKLEPKARVCISDTDRMRMFYRCTLGLRYLSEMSRTWHRQNYENTKGPHFKPLALPLPALIILLHNGSLLRREREGAGQKYCGPVPYPD